MPGLASGGEVVALDTEAVGLDLRDASLESVLEFRGLHGEDCRQYIRNVREFVRNLSLLEPEEREASLVDRQEELGDMAAGLRRTGRSYWRRPMARVAIGGGWCCRQLGVRRTLASGARCDCCAARVGATQRCSWRFLLLVRGTAIPRR